LLLYFLKYERNSRYVPVIRPKDEMSLNLIEEIFRFLLVHDFIGGEIPFRT
jgi:hypothetical protein